MDYRSDHLLNVQAQRQHIYFYFIIQENTALETSPSTRLDSSQCCPYDLNIPNTIAYIEEVKKITLKN